jgi:hypothetical protein
MGVKYCFWIIDYKFLEVASCSIDFEGQKIVAFGFKINSMVNSKFTDPMTFVTMA